jgi:hypothetical protein
MEKWQERVCEEKAELDKKIVKLEKFLTSDVFLSFDGYSSERLIRQYRAMLIYSNTLNERIINF